MLFEKEDSNVKLHNLYVDIRSGLIYFQKFISQLIDVDIPILLNNHISSPPS